MNLWHAAILGVVQGATEYLPVSSSGHLVLAPYVLGFDKAPFVFDILVQLGTLLGVLVYFAEDLIEVVRDMWTGIVQKDPFGTPAARFGWLVGVASIPAGVIGILVHDIVEEAFGSPRVTIGFLLLTAVLLALGERFGSRRRSETELTTLDAIVVGFAQVLALFPGVSRSGSTIAAGMGMGLTRAGAAKFSFVMSIPVMAGAGLLAMKNLLEDPTGLETHGPAIAVGFVTSAISGYVVIKWFLGFLKKRSLLWFAGYCALVGSIGLLVT